jgi:sortase A
VTRSWGAPLAAALLFLGVAGVAEGGWIRAKAQLAQWLLERAWDRSRGPDREVRPWPWADTWPVARLRAPTLGVDAIVLEGATGASLAFGPGHLEGTPLPGRPGNAVVAGHRDTQFAFLRELRVGDPLELELPDGSRLAYLVREAGVVDERDPAVAAPSPGRVLTLLTCYPFDALVPGGPLRYAVRAEAAGSRFSIQSTSQ